MENLITLIQLIAVFLAAIILGNWFSSEAKKCKAKGEPVYRAYLTTPGILILLIIIGLPILVWFLKK